MSYLLHRMLNRPVAVSMFFGALLLAGFFAFSRLPIELAPSMEFPSLTVTATWSGTSPETVEMFLTAPIEEVINTVAGVKRVRSRSAEGSSSVDVEFEQATDMNFARLELYEKLAALAETFPAGVAQPLISRYVPEDFEQLQGFLTFALGGKETAAEVRRFAREQFVPALLSVKGVANVEVVGGEERELHVILEPERIAALGLSVQAVVRELQDVEFIAALGVLKGADRRTIVVVRNTHRDASQMLDIPLMHSPNGRVVRLGDVATIEDGTTTPQSIYRINGKPAVTVVVNKEPHTNIIAVADRVFDRITELRRRFGNDIECVTVIDKSKQMREELENVQREIGVSIVAIVLVLVATLGNVRAPLVLFVSLLLSLAGTFVVFWLLGLSLHLLTLAGLVLGMGRVVDDAIVVIDNIQRRTRGETSDAKLVAAVDQVRLPVIASTITTVGALVPMFFLPRDLKPYFAEFAFAVGIALLISLLVSFTIIPTIVRNAPGVLVTPPVIVSIGEKILDLYRSLLRICLRYRKTVVVLVALAFGLPVWLVPQRIESEHRLATLYNAVMDSEWGARVRPYVVAALGGVAHVFFTKVTKGEVWSWGSETYLIVRVGFPQGTEMQRYDDVARAVEREIAFAPVGVSRVTTRIADDYAMVRVDFDERSALTAAPYLMKNRLTVLAAQTGGASIAVYGFGPGFYSGGESAPTFYVKVLGYNYAKVRQIAEHFKERIERNPRIAEVDIDRTFGRWPRSTEVVMQFDRDRLAIHHLRVADLIPWVGSLTRTTLDHRSLTLAGERVPYQVKLRGFDSISVEDVRQAPVVNVRGEVIQLGRVVAMQERRVMSEIRRENQQYVRWISFEYRGPYRYGDEFIEETIRAMPLPHGYKLERESGWFFMTEKETRSLLWTAVLALGIVFMVTASLYESLTKPLIVIVTVPLSLMGLFAAFALADASFGRGGYGAVILLIGIVVSHAIVLVDYITTNMKPQECSIHRLAELASERVRAIAMTSLTTIAALLPLLLFSAPSSIWFGLSLGAIGGMVSSTFLSLFLIPLLLSMYYKMK